MQPLHVVLLLIAAGVGAVPLLQERDGNETPLWVRSGKWQGDIVLTPDQERDTRNGREDVRYRWPNATLVYKLRDGDFDATQAAKVRSGLEAYNERTCVTVREATAADGVNYVLVTREDSGCWSYVGCVACVNSNYRPQELNLQDNRSGTCLTNSIVQHEFLHAWGFYHEHSSANRDQYVDIFWENIEEGRESAFALHANSLDYGCAYDLDSNMHYGTHAFSKNNEPTILAKSDPNRSLGNSIGLTDLDINKLSCMYADIRDECKSDCKC